MYGWQEDKLLFATQNSRLETQNSKLSRPQHLRTTGILYGLQLAAFPSGAHQDAQREYQGEVVVGGNVGQLQLQRQRFGAFGSGGPRAFGGYGVEALVVVVTTVTPTVPQEVGGYTQGGYHFEVGLLAGRGKVHAHLQWGQLYGGT